MIHGLEINLDAFYSCNVVPLLVEMGSPVQPWPSSRSVGTSATVGRHCRRGVWCAVLRRQTWWIVWSLNCAHVAWGGIGWYLWTESVKPETFNDFLTILLIVSGCCAWPLSGHSEVGLSDNFGIGQSPSDCSSTEQKKVDSDKKALLELMEIHWLVNHGKLQLTNRPTLTGSYSVYNVHTTSTQCTQCALHNASHHYWLPPVTTPYLNSPRKFV